MSERISFNLVDTKTDVITCKVTKGNVSFYLHSSYDPMKEAKRFISTHMKEIQENQNIIVYGLGCGYHILELLEETKESCQEIEVWDWNLNFFQFIRENSVIQKVINNRRVKLQITEDKHFILEEWKNYDSNNYLIIHEPSLKLVPDTLEDLKQMMNIYLSRTKTMIFDKHKLENNFKVNIDHYSFDYNKIVNTLRNIPMVLAAAGPSLKNSYHGLKELQNYFMLGAVGTALKPLVNHNIYPDFIMMTDPSDRLIEQYNDVEEDILKSLPLFYLSTISPSVVKAYPGPKIMLLQNGFELAEQFAETKKLPLVNTGGSVATTLLDWMIKLGAKQITFVGQDLAYTNNMTHVEGTHDFKQVVKDNVEDLIKVDNYFKNGQVLTSINLLSYKRWIEEYIRKNGDITFYNATQGGAYIEGCIHLSINESINQSLKMNIKESRDRFKALIME